MNLQEALDLAENFYDGTDYHFDRLAPSEQEPILAAARLVAEGGDIPDYEKAGLSRCRATGYRACSEESDEDGKKACAFHLRQTRPIVDAAVKGRRLVDVTDLEESDHARQKPISETGWEDTE